MEQREVTVIPARSDVREKGRGKTDGDALRVAAYCRVSTEEDNQRNSYQAQIRYYREYISGHDGWEIAGIFADEGISGTQTKNRKQFKRLMRLCRKGQIDLILCKSISRFARNTVDLLDTVRELKRIGIAVIFEKENLDTEAVDSEFFLALYASFAQAESESISRNITWGIEKSFREGNVRCSYQTLGYRRGPDGHTEVVPEEAEIVREIFRRFISGESMGKIAGELTERRIVRRCGRTVWNRKNVEMILRNERYAGRAVLQKSYTVDCLTHQRAKNTGEKPMYIVRNCHEAIVDEETFSAAQRELRRRSDAWREAEEKRRERKRAEREEKEEKEEERAGRDGREEEEEEIIRIAGRELQEEKSAWSDDREFPPKMKRRKYALNRLLVCGCCGSSFRRVIWKYRDQRYAVWRCSLRLEHGSGVCPSSALREDRLQNALIEVLNRGILEENRMKEFDDEEIGEMIGDSIRRLRVISEHEAILFWTDGRTEKIEF